jgi:hypothetical protein
MEDVVTAPGGVGKGAEVVSAIESDERGKPVVAQYKYGIKVPKGHREQAIFYNKTADIKKIKLIREAAENGATWRVAAAQAGMLPKEFEYMMALGRAGHPAYAQLVDELIQARGKLSRQLHERAAEHAMSDEGVRDGSLEKMIKAEERDSWLDNESEYSVSAGSGLKVNFNVNFGTEKPVEHDAEDVEFEEVELEGEG